MTEQKPVGAVHSAIVQVADALRQEGVSKDKKVMGGGNYRYRGIDDVYQALSPLLAKAHLYIAPIKMEKDEELEVGKAKMRLVRLLVTYRVTCSIDGSSIEVVALGDGVDSGDKASGKAMSYAYKSLMFQLFCIPVEGQPDTDTDASPAEPQQFSEPVPYKRKYSVEQFADVMAKTCDASSLEELNEIGKQIASLGLVDEDKKKITAAFKARRAELNHLA